MDYELIRGRLYQIRNGRPHSVRRDYIVQDPNGNITVQVSGKVATFSWRPGMWTIQNPPKAIWPYPNGINNRIGLQAPTQPETKGNFCIGKWPYGARYCECLTGYGIYMCNFNYPIDADTPEVDKVGNYVYRLDNSKGPDYGCKVSDINDPLYDNLILCEF